MATVVFLGPTMPLAEAAGLIAADFRPPARRGDIYRAFRDGYDTIVLIDGEFHGRPAVWQREITDVIADGATVHGASSMGALRAAELHTYGMIGHGPIFEWYRDGVIDADDEVALIYGPEELGYPPASEPLVNIRATLAAAVPAVLDAAEAERLVAQSKALYFPDRSFDAVVADARPEDRDRLARFIATSRVDRKRADAAMALRAAAAGYRPNAAPEAKAASNWWRRARLVAEGFAAVPHALNPAEIAERAGLSADELDALRRELSTQFFLCRYAEAQGIAAGEADFATVRDRYPAATLSDAVLAPRALAAAALRLRAANGGGGAAAIVRDWARAEGIDRPGMDDAALAKWVIDAGPNLFGYGGWRFEVELVEALRLAGRAAGAAQ